MYVVTEPEHDATDVSEGPARVLSHMSLGTQVSSELSHQSDASLSPQQSTEGEITLCLNLDPARPVAQLVGQMRTQLSPSQGLVPGSMRVPLLSNDDVVVLGQWIDQVRLLKLPLVQGVKIHLTQ